VRALGLGETWRHSGHGGCALRVFTLGLLCALGGSAVHSKEPSVPELLERHTYTDAQGSTLPYRLARPATFSSATSSQRFPLVVILHGAGQRGTDNEVQTHSIVPVFLTPENRRRYAAFVVAPQCAPDVKWTAVNWQEIPHAPQTKEPTRAARQVLELIEKLAAELPVDRARIYLVGVSMGGSGTWDLTTRRPDLFGGAVVLCGGADEATGHRLATLPVWCFQGAKDDVVVPSLSRNMIAAIQRSGGKPRYTEFPDAGHNIVDLVFRDPEVLAWLFAQRRRS
jgi:predicted peptidase